MPTVDEMLQGLESFEAPNVDQAGAALGNVTTKTIDFISEANTKLLDDLRGIDRSFDQSGVDDWRFRAGLSRADNKAEREQYLTKEVGAKGWTIDEFGNYGLTTEGMANLGHEPNAEGLPTIIDAPMTGSEPGQPMNWLPQIERGDIADLRGDAPAIVGGMAASMYASGMGIPAALGLTFLGASTAKALDEAADHFRGENLQDARDIASDITETGTWSAVSELGFRGLRGVGRRLLAPYANKMTPESKALLDDAVKMGARPSPTSVTGAKLASRFQSIANTIFGDPLAERNSKAINAAMLSLRRGASGGRAPGMGRRTVGETIARDITKARQALSKWSNDITRKIDVIAEGKPIIPTARLRAEAQDILDALPKTRPQVDAAGNVIPGSINKPIIMDPATISTMEGIVKMEDFVTTQQMQSTIATLFDAMQTPGMVPGMSTRNLRLLWKAGQGTFDDAAAGGTASQESIEMLKAFRTVYSRNIRKFDDSIISRIVRDPRSAGRLEPEAIVGVIFKKGQSSVAERVMRVLPRATKEKIRGAAMDEILSTLSIRTGKPLERMFSGKNFLNSLDKYGNETLDAMFGKPMRKQLYRLGEIVQLTAAEPAGPGALIAAGIATKPLQNLGRLTKLNLMSKMMSSPNGLKWLTEGLEAPNRRAGAAALTRFAVQAQALVEQETHDREE